ncbi:hypothetical protein DSM110093_04233 (plasmid) [Sulfitobacter sp. DSM 110093]|uniref:hypothetical protein n=1 Tax=Sulfitobacter sp. DSM 110093 TaxID=2883127 RepID=UPI001FAD2DEF|nr:hypothetical protein [Sulfitobacter sp. DSM 110093]UOA34397.1 hypothetical protein DSM110093_04233 [Sulfitobacter sp. DSM 110093]
MTQPDEAPPAEPNEMLLHDLRRFLHNAHDQHDVLVKIVEAMGGATKRIEEQDKAIKRILQALKAQIDKGVTVHLNADLNTHVGRVSAATAPLIDEIRYMTQMGRRVAVAFTASCFIAGVSGGFVGVFAALRVL